MAYFRGYPCSPELAEWLTWYERVLLHFGVIQFCIDVFQLKGTYYKSAGVHEDGYAFDIAQMGSVALDVADQMGAFSWPRTRAQGFKPHQHGGLYGIKDMNAGLAGQGRDRKNGWNGLVGRHRKRDPRPVSGRDWKQGIAWAKALLAKEATVYPADIFGKNWKLTVPADGPDAGSTADEVKQPALATYESLWCRVNSGGDSVVFTVHHGAPTTPGSKNPRSELREMTNQGLNLAKWDGRTGKHRMEVELSINRLTKVKPHTVLAQIHDGSDDITTLRAEGVKGTDRIKMWLTRGDNSHAHYLGEVKLTQRFRFAFDVAAGKVRFDWNGGRVSGFTVPAAAASFFKVGAYLQSNPDSAPSESSAAYTQVRMFSKPKVAHS